VPAHLAAPRRRVVEQVLQSGQAAQFTDERDGTWLHHTVTPIRDAAGRVSRLVTFATDISAIRHSEAALRDSEERFRSMAEHFFDLIAVTDGEGIIEYNSPAARTMFGVEPAEAVGRHFTDFLDGP
jgi:PAS domain-containing protein